MITRSDFNEHAFEELIRTTLYEQLQDLLMDTDLDADHPLVTAYKYVIAYNSVPGEFEDGRYDLSS